MPRVSAAKSSACTKDGQRDYTLTTIYNAFHKVVNGGVSSADRWGIPQSTFRVEKLDTQLKPFEQQRDQLLDDVKQRLRDQRAAMLSDGTRLEFAQSANGVTITLPPATGDAIDRVVVLRIAVASRGVR